MTLWDFLHHHPIISFFIFMGIFMIIETLIKNIRIMVSGYPPKNSNIDDED